MTHRLERNVWTDMPLIQMTKNTWMPQDGLRGVKLIRIMATVSMTVISKKGCRATCEICKSSNVIPQFQLCIGEQHETTTMIDSYSLKGAELMYQVNDRKCLKLYDPSQHYPAASGNLDMHVAIRLSECENDDAEDCLRKRCKGHGWSIECEGEWMTLVAAGSNLEALSIA